MHSACDRVGPPLTADNLPAKRSRKHRKHKAQCVVCPNAICGQLVCNMASFIILHCFDVI